MRIKCGWICKVVQHHALSIVNIQKGTTREIPVEKNLQRTGLCCRAGVGGGYTVVVTIVVVIITLVIYPIVAMGWGLC